ncbi:hypothetical protein P872_17585 [Rhodonellum psychrophilum GCM71 = DSM 17998]|uniref:6-phosphogluconate dehydrogenase, decarboxylating n=2 Tax=Rhodonellum TaxID=336827 RepID=U5C015_9BACT|nr:MULTISPECIES: NADP-dependent phosphogluconate dehydrogenase [Rhodonellum]ERM83159.1 hypothetical protein P872_17585 [Rhodonellum psychrophilum GCM71 = DSM 17998]SDY98942.1 6-phosphogluconate dehydrogenase [Rhodonellum ikkaensis]
MIIIVTGVSGSGKTTIGSLLAKRLNLPFYDADDFHPAVNVEKMQQGIPLTDHDREPWLNHLAEKIEEWNSKQGAILACSALKEEYREILQVVPHIHWIHLKGEKQLLAARLSNRKNHYMNPDLLTSQMETWEDPSYGLHLDVKEDPGELVEQAFKYLTSNPFLSKMGVIGMGVMGKSLALNLAEKGVPVSVFNRHVPQKEEKIASAFASVHSELHLLEGFDEMEGFLGSLEKPRNILLMIPAGAAIDQQIEQLIPLLEEGDLIIDGGNSFYEDSSRRSQYLRGKGFHFLPMGVSGGEEGARKGPSMMPGGDREGYVRIAPFLEKIGAKDKHGKPCVTYVGPDGSGHFVKMVHNSIEYAEMQALAETVHLMRYGLKINPIEISQVLKGWAEEGLKSYLLEITANILLFKENSEFLLDRILDVAGQKGTGAWSLTTALKYNVPYSPLSEAVAARNLSGFKKEREELGAVFGHKFLAFREDKNLLLESLKNAYALTRIINHEVGFSLMSKVSEDENWDLNLSEIARIWTNGCIIRSGLMEDLVFVFETDQAIFRNNKMVLKIRGLKKDLTSMIGLGLQHDFALPVMSAAANYLFGRITANSSANLLQAQRDYFGAHTYQIKGDPSGAYFHTDWLLAQKKTR